MPDFSWEVYCDTPAWVSVGVNTLVFSGSETDLSEPITVGSWNLGTHIGSGTPGTDQCGTEHVPNVQFVTTTQFDKGTGTLSLSDGNLAATECSVRILFTDAAEVAISNARFYCFNGTTETEEAVGVEVYAFERGESNTEWTLINDDSGNIGGDNSGERLSLADKTAATEHEYYLAVSVRPETVGAKTEFELGVALTYS